MGLFNRKPKNKLYKSRVEERTAEKLVQQMPSLGTFLSPVPGADYDKIRRDQEDQGERRKAEQKANKGALLQAGVKASRFTKPKSLRDAQELVYDLTPIAERFAVSLSDAKAHISFFPLTKAGKVPKNVVGVSMAVEEKKKVMTRYGFEAVETGDQIICHIKYLANGEVNMLDYHLWHSHVRHGVFVRRINNQMLITKLDRMDMNNGVKTELFSEKNPLDNEPSKRIAEQSIKALLAR